MATTSLSHQDHEGNDTPLEPFYPLAQENTNDETENWEDPLKTTTSSTASSKGNQDHEGNDTPLEPFYPFAQENTNDETENWEDPLTTTTSSTASSKEWNDADFSDFLPLYRAALNGDWESASAFFKHDPDALTAMISNQAMTALHVAANVGRSRFVEKLAKQMPAEALAMQDDSGMTALHYAAMSGITKAAKALVRKEPALTQIRNAMGYKPIMLSFRSSNREMVWFLSTVTTDEPPGNPFANPLAAELICGITTAGFHDIAIHLIQRYPHLAIARDNKYSSLRVLAGQPSAFRSGSKLGFWKRCIYPFVLVELNTASRHLLGGDVENRLGNSGSVTYLTRVLQWAKRLLGKVIVRLVPGIIRVRDEKLRHKQAAELVELVCIQLSQMRHSQISEFFDEQAILTTATSNGIVEIVTRCLRFFPDIIGPMVNNQRLFQVAIEHRREKIFSLLRENTSRSVTWASWKVESENTILHLAAKLPPASQLKCVSGSALQIQRELQWFKEVENFASPVLRGMKNTDKKTPWELFMDDHKELVEKGEKWMKDTSTSCMVVATLIATVVFAAAFTVPGGNDNNNGIPIFLMHNSFMMFAISNALALFSATTSLLMFLSILTARYAEEDFLTSLPKRLILGLASLFFAIAAMMIAFSAALSIVLNERLKWVYIPITLVACLPVTIFAMLQLPLFIQMFQSTYGSGIFHRRSNLRL